jgi:hypothetical protein
MNPKKPTTSDRDAARARPQDVDQPSPVDPIMAVLEQQEVTPPMRATCFEPQQHCRSTRKYHISSYTVAQLLEVIDAALVLIAEDEDCVQ